MRWQRRLKLKMKDAREFDVPIATLSPADFEYAKARYAAMQAAPAAAPAVAMPATPAGTPPSATPPAATPKGGAKVVASKPAPPRPPIKVIPASTFKAPAANDYLSGISQGAPAVDSQRRGLGRAQRHRSPPIRCWQRCWRRIKASGEDLLQDPGLTRINGDTGGEGPKAIYRIGLLGALALLRWGFEMAGQGQTGSFLPSPTRPPSATGIPSSSTT
jgi:hypothetical protein